VGVLISYPIYGFSIPLNPYMLTIMQLAGLVGNYGYFVIAYVPTVLIFVGIALLVIAAKRGTNPWTMLLVATGVGVVLASLAPALILERWPDCITCRPPTFHPALWEFVHSYPTLTLALAVLSVLLVPVGWVLQNRPQLSALAWVFLRLPLMMVVVVGIAALILFPNPYYGGTI
jgi:hypothetical protein